MLLLKQVLKGLNVVRLQSLGQSIFIYFWFGQCHRLLFNFGSPSNGELRHVLRKTLGTARELETRHAPIDFWIMKIQPIDSE